MAGLMLSASAHFVQNKSYPNADVGATKKASPRIWPRTN
jgi:hypothetical protein